MLLPEDTMYRYTRTAECRVLLAKNPSFLHNIMTRTILHHKISDKNKNSNLRLQYPHDEGHTVVGPKKHFFSFPIWRCFQH